jgi:hypothetical protein
MWPAAHGQAGNAPTGLQHDASQMGGNGTGSGEPDTWGALSAATCMVSACCVLLLFVGSSLLVQFDAPGHSVIRDTPLNPKRP